MKPSSESKPTTLQHFDTQSEKYDQLLGRWPISQFKANERKVVLDLLGSVADQRFLDVGCGHGFYLRSVLPEQPLCATGVDLSPSMVAALPDTVEGIVGDGASFTVSQSYGRIVCAGLLEFVDQPVEVLKNIRRFATEETVLVLLNPRPGFWGTLYTLYHRSHGVSIHLFTPETVKQQAASAGWTLTNVKKSWPLATAYQLIPTVGP
ncbi:class I SAM-dependent methyltransferase [Magnetococcus sp. PR-3]|uniref:class I SAM-dependent methyltransferase n=1 Tax=Magnetococcus sp. PR-3 TaxID=3120355 RepID=UPI002FCE075B